jgi:tetrahydromethanopterin S-methyltransferase subunit G
VRNRVGVRHGRASGSLHGFVWGLTLIAVGSEVASDFAALNPGYLL